MDSGALVDILFHEAFIRMGYIDSQLTPSDMAVYFFNGIETKVEGIIQLPMTMGQETCEVTQLPILGRTMGHDDPTIRMLIYTYFSEGEK